LKLLNRLLIIITVVGLVLVGIFVPTRQVSIKGLGTLSIGAETACASPGWLSDWSYRRAVNLSPATAAADYQVLVTLTTGIMGSPYANVQPDGSDIRFTTSDETTLQDYWVESWDSNGTSRIWIEVTAPGTSTLYMYYGNAAASSASDGSATFDFFDDFSGDLSQWTIDPENTDNKVYIYNGALRHDPDSSQTKNSYYDTRIRTTNYKILDGVIEYSVYLAGSTSSSPRIIHQLGFRVQSLNFENGYCWRVQNSYGDGGHLRFTGRASWVQFGMVFPDVPGNTWHTVKEVVSGSTYTGYVDGGSAYSGTDNTKLTADYLVSHVHGVSLTASSYVLVDNIRVRKYASPEPTATVGSEEHNSAPDPPSGLNPPNFTDGSWVDDDTPTLNFTQSDPDGNTVSYTIQIDNDDDFSSPAVDYTSELMAQGPASFTVGQAEGGGNYTSGGEGQTLNDDDYYWRVMSTDEHGFDGDWTVANGGEVAFRLDTIAPTVMITSTATDPTNVSPIPMTATFSEDVTGFTLGDITVSNGTAGNLAGSGSVYTFDVTPVADGLVTVDIAAGVAQDAAGNDNTAATQFSISYDAEAPAVTITSTATDPTNVSPIPMTATFSEDVTGFTLGDITVSNGTAGNLAGSGSVYTFDVTPVADGLVTVDIAAGVAQDAAGNDNTAALQFSIAYDATGQTGGTTKDKYRTNETVEVSAGGFLPDSDVDVYVVRDYHWNDGDPIPPDSGAIFAHVLLTTDGSGNITNQVVWIHPLKIGEYDVVFDAGQDGFYNATWDLVDHPNHPGFTVVAATVGGEVHTIDKTALLMPWLGLVVLLLALAGAYLARLTSNKPRG
jgi:hypothetical protein